MPENETAYLDYLNKEVLEKLKKSVARPQRVDLWGNEIESPSDQDNWNAVMECLGRLYGIYYYEKDSSRTEWALKELMETYNRWLG